MTKRKAEIVEEPPPPRDQTPLKYGMKDPATWIDPKRVSEFIERVFA
jgi:hypothetical protein